MDLRRLAIALALTALLALATGLGTASAKKTSYNTQVTIDQGGPSGAEGHVSSGQDKCLKGRRVSLFIVDELTGYLVKIGTAITDGDGNWEVVEDLFAGEYTAKVEAKDVKVQGKQRRCKGARSRPKRL